MRFNHTLMNSTLSGWTDRIASVLPCKYALVIAGSYTHSMRPGSAVKSEEPTKLNQRTKRTVKPKVGSLECHLYERIWTKSMAGYESFPIASELECRTLVLTNECAKSRLRKSHADAERRGHVPVKLLWCSIDRDRFKIGRVSGTSGGCECTKIGACRCGREGSAGRLEAWWLVRFGIGREARVEESRGIRVDGAGEEHQPIGEDVRGESGILFRRHLKKRRKDSKDSPQDSMTINPCMLKVDSGRPICAYNDLELYWKVVGTIVLLSSPQFHTHLIIPSVCTSSNLFPSFSQLVCPAHVVAAQVANGVGCRVVETYDKQSFVHN
jgi:hypothetical protein